MRIEKLRTEHNVKVEWVHFPLHPETPAEGRALGDLFKGRSAEQRAAMHGQMKARMAAEGLPYGDRTMTYNSRLAQELGKWADTQPGGTRGRQSIASLGGPGADDGRPCAGCNA